MKRKKRQFADAALFILTAVAVYLGGCGGSTVASNSTRSSTATPEATKTAGPQPAAKETAPARAVASGEALSVLSVEHQVDLSSEQDGVVISIYKDEGNLVSAGDVLGQIDDRALQLELIKAQDDLKVAQNNVKYKEAELRAKSAALDREKQLRQMGLSSQADLEAADFAAKAADYDLHGWEAQAESSQAEMNRISLLIDKTRLRAPFSGVVARRYVREGQTVVKNDKCFRVSQLSPLLVQFQIPETSALPPKLGNTVDVYLLDNSQLGFSARITKISPTIDPASDSYNVTAQLSASRIASLRPGMAVRVTWEGRPASGAHR